MRKKFGKNWCQFSSNWHLNRCTTVITWGFHVCGSHCLPHINSYTIAGFLPSEHLPVLHLGEAKGTRRQTEHYRKKLIRYLRFIPVDFIHSCHHRLKKSNFILEKNWPAGDQLTTAFTILNCLEHEFLNGFLVQGRRQSFWKSSILSKIMDLQWCLPNKRKIHS